MGVRSVTFVCSLVVAAGLCHADDATAAMKLYAIAPQSVSSALKEFAAQSEFQLIFTEADVGKATTEGVRGELAPSAALDEILKGTNLKYEITSNHVVVIQKPTPTAPATSSLARGNSFLHLAQADNATGADTTRGPAEAKPQPSDKLEEIVVTAMKKEQSLKDVPLSVSAIGERTIELAGISTFTDYARMTPGVSFDYAGPGGGQLGDRSVFIRGISSTNTTSGGQPVGFYIGETPVPFSDPNLFDINRIEILRGPQGTLYGSGSLGGTVKIVPNSPNAKEFASKVESTVSSTQGGGINYEARGMVNIPVVEDKIAIRATVAQRHDEGYIDNAGTSLVCADPDPSCLRGVLDTNFKKNINDVDRTSVRVASTIKLTDNLTITPGIFAEKLEIADRAHHTIGFENGPDGLLTNVAGPANKEENDFALYDMGVSYDFGGSAALTSSTSYMDWKKDNVLSLSYLIQNIFGLPPTSESGLASAVKREIFTHESRIASTGVGNNLDWLAGVFYQREAFSFGNYAASQDIPLPNKLLSVSDTTTITKQFAIFTEETFHLTDRWSLTGGLRWFRTEVSSTNATTASLFQGDEDSFEALGPATETGFTPKLELSYKPNDSLLFYALAAKGFRAGGPTRTPANIPDCVSELATLGLSPASSFDSDSVWNYEGGAKTVWADGKLTANVAGYYIDWDNIQQELQLQCGFSFTTNFGKAKNKGAELELRAAPMRGLDLGFSVGYIDARLAQDNVTGVGKKGDMTLQTPKWTTSVEGQYSVPVSFGMSAYVHGTYQYIDRAATTFNTVGVPNDATFRPSYKVASFSAGLMNDAWEVSVFMQNAFNERPQFVSFVDSFGAQFPQAITIQPKTIGATVRRSF